MKYHNISGFTPLQHEYMSSHNTHPLTPEGCEPEVHMKRCNIENKYVQDNELFVSKINYFCLIRRAQNGGNVYWEAPE